MGVLEKISFLHQLFKLEDLSIGVAFVFIAACFASKGLPSSGYFRLVVAIFFCILGLASINSLNQVYDVESDTINKPERPIPSGRLTKQQMFSISFSLSLSAGLLTLYLGWTYFMIALAGLCIGGIYCLPQIYAKANIFFSTVVIGIGYGLLMFMVGWCVYRPITTIPLWLLVFLYVHEVFIVLSKDFSDMEGDRGAGIATIPVIYGKARGAVLCLVLYLTPFMFLLIFQLMDYLSRNFYPTIILGVVFGSLIFGFCSFQEKKYNYLGYSFYVIGTVVVRIALLFAYIS